MNAIINEIIEQAKEQGLTSFGIRQHHKSVSIGEELPVSCNTLDDCEPEELEGTCCISVSFDTWDEVEDIEYDLGILAERTYQDGPTILVGGKSHEEGNDLWEIVIEDAVCLHVF